LRLNLHLHFNLFNCNNYLIMIIKINIKIYNNNNFNKINIEIYNNNNFNKIWQFIIEINYNI